MNVAGKSQTSVATRTSGAIFLRYFVGAAKNRFIFLRWLRFAERKIALLLFPVAGAVLVIPAGLGLADRPLGKGLLDVAGPFRMTVGAGNFLVKLAVFRVLV